MRTRTRYDHQTLLGPQPNQSPGQLSAPHESASHKGAMLLFSAFALIVTGAVVLTAFCYWDHFASSGEPPSQTIRNFALVALGVIALGVATWRSISASRQADIALRQVDIAETNVSDDRFARAIELLSNDDKAIRGAAVYVLGHLAVQRPERYGKEVKSIIDGLSAQLHDELERATEKRVTPFDLALLTVRKELDGL